MGNGRDWKEKECLTGAWLKLPFHREPTVLARLATFAMKVAAVQTIFPLGPQQTPLPTSGRAVTTP